MNQLLVSVIICTHNPRRDYLDRVLEALKQQTLRQEQWELLLIDNASDRVLADEIDLSWHFQAHHIREEQLGLTPARLRGIRESQAELLILVDDDNVLAPNYLETARDLSQQWTMIGAWGGQVLPEFEEQSQAWIKPYWGNLALKELDADRWGNIPQNEFLPCGAGMCLRRSVAQQYVKLVQAQSMRMQLDRKGKSLMSGGDTDIAFTACHMGLGIGVFKALMLTHLIPKFRLQEDYLLRLQEAMYYSGIVMQANWGNLPVRTWRTRFAGYARRWFMDARSRRFHDAAQRGIDAALRDLAQMQLKDS
ncbi:glycosyltransferase [Leptolyngbya sp. NIES-2104]|uniref:glycosyltransferase n=1 Tax=Leptolyngbya sp. NIES-2104 TaxID=1552121 RepID=UPI0006EC6241|nr:glycosyltransferase [Leptolyngbya sp. NIES-2104]GAP95136.1 probable glycosyl transferase [Leptolyngbya sp. NIES-2104]